MRWPAAILLFCASAAEASSLQVTGLVTHPGPVALDALKPVSVDARFATMHGAEAHRWSGPLLLDVVNVAGLQDAPGKKTHMRHVFLAAGSDGYTVAVAIGETDAKAEGKQVIVALREDDKILPAPRLIVPGDASFTRGVHDLVSIEVK